LGEGVVVVVADGFDVDAAAAAISDMDMSSNRSATEEPPSSKPALDVAQLPPQPPPPTLPSG